MMRHSAAPRDRRRALVAARFADLAGARGTIEALQAAGVDGDDITLLSPFGERSETSTQAADRRMLGYLTRRVFAGVAVGVVVGGIVGAVAGAILVAVTSASAVWGEVVACVLVGAILGAPLGAYIAFERAGTLTDAWGTTFEDVEPGAIWVGVKTHDTDGHDRARRVLQHHRALEVRDL
jgi:hypothetical protein